MPLSTDLAVTLQIVGVDATTAWPLRSPNSMMSAIEHFCPVTEYVTGKSPPNVPNLIGVPTVPEKTVFVKIRIDFGNDLGKSKFLGALVSALKPVLAAFVAVTTHRVVNVVLKTNVTGSIAHPRPSTAKVTAPVPEPPELLRINLIDDEEILSWPVTLRGTRDGVAVGVGFAAELGACGTEKIARRTARRQTRAAQ